MKTESVLIGGVSYNVRSLLDLQQFDDPGGDALKLGISSAFWPLFGQIWPMSNVLARVMLTESLEKRRVLEIGCGLALPSMVVKKLGGAITASDYHPLAETFLLENTILNSLDEIPFKAGNWNVSSLRPEKYDLIIGSDLLYEERCLGLLASYLERHLTRKGRVILVDPARGLHRKFVREMQGLEFGCTWTDLKLYPKGGLRQKGFIFRFSRAPATWKA